MTIKFSYNDLKNYFTSPIPSPEILAKELSLKSLEIEKIEPVDGDYLIEAKVLPDRPDCHKTEGLAKEIGAIFNLPLISEFSKISDEKNHKNKISFTADSINSILGINLTQREIICLLNRLGIGVKEGKNLTAFTPTDRSDLNIMEDLADEIARLFGIDKIQAVPLPRDGEKMIPNKVFDLSNKLRETLLGSGFSEIYGYTFVSNGDIKIKKPLASDKAYLRTNLSDGLKEKLQLNLQNIFFDKDPVKIFEIGAVFPLGVEEIHLAVGIGFKSAKFKKTGLPEEIKKWGGKITQDEISEILEIDLNNLIKKIDWQGGANLGKFINLEVKFKPFSVYPRIFRDIALWVKSGIKSEAVISVIRQHAGEFLQEGPVLFDEFKKGDKTSFAFRMAFQSKDKTLTDEEVNKFMKSIEEATKRNGWEVR